MGFIASMLAALAAIRPGTLQHGLMLSAFAGLIIGFAVLIRQRLKVRNLPGPPHNLIMGHLPVMVELAKHTPQDLHPQAQMTMLQRVYNLGDLFCVDIWPLMDQVYVISNPDLAYQVAQKRALPRHPMALRFIKPFTGMNSLMIANGNKWKELKAIFSAGFSNANLMTMIPVMVEKTEVFRSLLAEYASEKRLFQMEVISAKLTVDIIGLVVLGVDFDTLRGEDELVSAFRKLLTLMPDSQKISLNPFRPLLRIYYGHVMDNYIRRALRAHMAKGPAKQRTLMDVAIEKFQERKKTHPNESEFSSFEQIAVDNLKTFVFAGHDTSSTTISYVYHLLGKHPEALRKVREEHDRVLGKDVAQTAKVLCDNPTIINRLPYTTAVIKETLRLYPVSGSLRLAEKGTTFTPRRGPPVTLSEPSLVWVAVHTMHHDPDLFPCPDEFHPERFLDAYEITHEDGTKESVPAGWNGHVPPNNAYRPFERGPRQCTGSEMAMIEVRIVLAMTLREFRFEVAFDDWARLHPEERKASGDIRTAFGDEAYQVFSATAKPKMSMPMRVSMDPAYQGHARPGNGTVEKS